MQASVLTIFASFTLIGSKITKCLLPLYMGEKTHHLRKERFIVFFVVFTARVSSDYQNSENRRHSAVRPRTSNDYNSSSTSDYYPSTKVYKKNSITNARNSNTGGK